MVQEQRPREGNISTKGYADATYMLVLCATLVLEATPRYC